MAGNSKALDTLARVASGRRIQLTGPTGKRYWHAPDWRDVRWAIELIANKLVPNISAHELSGRDGGKIEIEASRGDSLDIARRLEFAASELGLKLVNSDGGAASAPHVPMLEATKHRI